MLDNVRRQFFESILQENPELASGDIQKKQSKRAKAKARTKAKAKANAKSNANPNAKSKAKSKAKASANANGNANPPLPSPSAAPASDGSKPVPKSSAASNPKQQKSKTKAIVPPEPVRKIGLNFSEMPKLQESMSMLNAKPSATPHAGSATTVKPKGENEKNEKSGVGGKSEVKRTVPKPAKITFKPITPIFPHL